jgi:DNA-binding response OmpR family regulator
LRSLGNGEDDLAFNALAGRTILVLEDEYLIAMDVEQLCRDAGAADVVIMRAIAETGGAEAVSAAFDVAILDLMLSGMSTIEFARELHELGMPFVFASGYTDNDEIFSRFPGVSIVGKPYSSDELIAAVAEACGKRVSQDSYSQDLGGV